MYGTYKGDDTEAFWELAQGVAASREVYVSWWEYDESQGRFNDEMFLMRPYLDDSTGNLLQEDIIDWFGYGSSSHSGFNASDSIVVVEPQTNSTAGLTAAYYGQTATSLPWGSWTQWEVHWKANDPGVGNGQAVVYMNGRIIDQWTDKNFNASVDMTDQAIRVGGVYTKLTWWNGQGSFSPPGSCTNYIGDGTTVGAPRVPDFSQSCPCPNECPPNGHVPIFKRYFDDIIVLGR